MSDLFEAFIFTNGSDSFQHSLCTVTEQTLQCKIHVIKNMTLIEGINEALLHCDAEYFIKIDDDMLLHPRTFEFYHTQLKQYRSLAIYGCRLWEPWMNRFVQSVKAYHTATARTLGFQSDPRGKIDVPYFLNVLQSGYQCFIDMNSIVAVHALRSVNDQQRYREMWLRLSKISEEEYKSCDEGHMEIYEAFESYETQYQRIQMLNCINASLGSDFGKFNNDLDTSNREIPAR